MNCVVNHVRIKYIKRNAKCVDHLRNRYHIGTNEYSRSLLQCKKESLGRLSMGKTKDFKSQLFLKYAINVMA